MTVLLVALSGCAGPVVRQMMTPRDPVWHEDFDGRSLQCDPVTCREPPVGGNEVAAAVPALMQRSVADVGGRAERIGSFSWTLTSPAGVSRCHAVRTTGYRCIAESPAPSAL
jgi:hypothetical protein